MLFLDSHAHLDDVSYDKDREEVISRAKEAGVNLILSIGTIEKINDAEKTLSLINKEEIFGAFGVHPHDACIYNEELEKYLRELLTYPKVIAVGEIGLDYYYKNSDREAQIKAFKKQIDLAKEFNKFVIIHSREAASDTLKILKEEFAKENRKKLNGIMHCFSGSLEMAEECIKLGFLISFSGIITFQNAKKPIEVLKNIPLDFILSETDAPYLAPVPYRGKRNEPAYVIKVIEKIREVKKLKMEEIANVIYSNWNRLILRNRD